MQVPKFRFVLVDGGYIGEKEASQFLLNFVLPIIHPNIASTACGRTFHASNFHLGKVQQSPNFEFALSYLATFCTDLPRACEVEVGGLIQDSHTSTFFLSGFFGS